jgi:hypothetical protein
VRTLSWVAVLPIMLTRLPTQDIAVWYLLMTMVSLQQIADAGLAPTFTRVISFAMGGSSQFKDMRAVREVGTGAPNWDGIERIWSTMHRAYGRIALLAVPIFAVAGTLALAKPIGELAEPVNGWAAWAAVVLTFAVVIRANAFGAYIQGVNQVALLRRWETISGLGAILTTLLVLLLGAGLLPLVLAHQGWTVLNAIRDRAIARRVEGGRARSFQVRPRDAEIHEAIWPSAVRSGIGIAMSRGVLLSSGLVLAQVAEAALLAAYLMASRILQVVIDLANAPFYSKLPVLARLQAEGRASELEQTASRGMRLAYWTFVAGAVTLGVAAPFTFAALGGSVGWVPPLLGCAMTLSYLVERFGAMHIQLYSTTNHIVWHIANGVSGSLYLIISLALLGPLGVYAFPVGLFIAYTGFYSWYGPLKVKQTFSLDFWRLQRTTVMVPGLILIAYGTLELFLAYGAR